MGLHTGDAAADGGGLRRHRRPPRGAHRRVPATAARCSSRQRPRRSSTASSCATSASTGSRTCRAPERHLPARRGRVSAAEDAVSDEPARAGDAVPRSRARARARSRAPARDDVGSDADRPGRDREDAACAAGRGRARGRVPGRRLVGAARAGARRRARRSIAPQAMRRTGATGRRTRRTIGDEAAAAPARQRRARCSERPRTSPRSSLARGSTCSSRAASGCSSAASRSTRCRRSSATDGVELCSSQRARAARARLRAGRAASTSSAPGSTTCRWRSSSRRRGRRSSRRNSCSTRLGSGSTCSRRPRRRPAPADAARDDRMVVRAARLRRSSGSSLACPSSRGGCTLEAAEAVCGADLDTLAVAGRQEPAPPRDSAGRFWMLETIREFAAEQHRLTAEYDQVRRRHAEWYAQLGGWSASRRADAGRGSRCDGSSDRRARELSRCARVVGCKRFASARVLDRMGALVLLVLRGVRAEALRWAQWVVAEADKLSPAERAFGLLGASELSFGCSATPSWPNVSTRADPSAQTARVGQSCRLDTRQSRRHDGRSRRFR